MDGPESSCCIVRAGTLPDDFTPEVSVPKHGVHQDLQVVAGRGVAVEVDGAGGLEDAAQLHQPRRHHHQVGHHGVAAYELPEGGHHLLDVGGRCRVQHYLVLERALRLQRPLPRVGEGPYLRWRRLAGLLPEQHVIGCVGVEGRVQVHQVHRLVGHVLPQDVQVIAVEQSVSHASFRVP